MPDANVSKLRWLLAEASKNSGVTLNVNSINRVCAEQDRLMRENGMVLMWQSRIDETAKQMDRA